jgi:hypothetical protein
VKTNESTRRPHTQTLVSSSSYSRTHPITTPSKPPTPAAYIFQYPKQWPDTHGLALRLLLAAEACGGAVLERTAHTLVAKLLEQTVREVKADEVGLFVLPCIFKGAGA